MDISLTGVWWSWLEFRRGKKPSREILRFEEELFENLMILCADLNTGRYRHGEYTHRIINEKKRRDIYVASVRDRVVHRMMYDCLLPVFEPTFDYDVWNCRLGKGLHACLEREKELTRRYEFGYVWRADIKKFFDNVLQEVLVGCLERRALDGKVLGLCQEIVMSYSTGGGGIRGMPIGNLTSQLFANIYLNEWDRHVRMVLRPLGYVRYGDDFVLHCRTLAEALAFQERGTRWLAEELGLAVNPKMDFVGRAGKGLKYLGSRIY